MHLVFWVSRLDMWCGRKRQEGWLWGFGFKQQAKRSCHNKDREDRVGEVWGEKSRIQAGKLKGRLHTSALNLQLNIKSKSVWGKVSCPRPRLAFEMGSLSKKGMMTSGSSRFSGKRAREGLCLESEPTCRYGFLGVDRKRQIRPQADSRMEACKRFIRQPRGTVLPKLTEQAWGKTERSSQITIASCFHSSGYHICLALLLHCGSRVLNKKEIESMIGRKKKLPAAKPGSTAKLLLNLLNVEYEPQFKVNFFLFFWAGRNLIEEHLILL